MTIEQAMQGAIEAHKAGRLQDAEALYKAILQANPKHPDANHNLGLLKASLNKTESAIPYFKTALKANPNQGQFWISYVNALINEKQFENASNLLEQGKKLGLTGEKVEVLESILKKNWLPKNLEFSKQNTHSTNTQKRTKISTKKEKRNLSINLKNKKQITSPTKIELDELLECYQNGQHNLAQNLATSLTQNYPKHPFAWKVLGALFKQIGKLQDSVIINQKVLEISPNDAEAHYNLGNSLKELYRLKDAETSYRKAISFKPDYARAYFNLGITLQELGRLDEAESSYKKAIAIKPDLAEAHSNLGNILKELGKLENAELSYKRAIAFNPDLAEAYYNLGNTLKELGRLEEAEASCSQAIILEPSYLKARSEMLTCLYSLDKKKLFFEMLDYFITEDKFDPVVGSLTSRSALKYGGRKPNIFCNEPLKHTLIIDLKSRYNFEEVFIKNVKSILREDNGSNKIQPLLFKGYQTSGNLFDIKNNFTNQIEKTIRLEIERYRLNFVNSQEGFLRKWPTEYSLYGWLIVMKSGGELSPHIHENGWLSGSIYINVPPKSKIDSGSLVVALGKDSDTTDPSLNSKKIIDVVTGSMVLFPASLMHHTIPFESEEERIVLAFDVIPR